jgi:apolipoprotein N-acyltransferase
MRVSPSRWSVPVAPLLAAVLSGVLLSLAYPPVSIGPLAFVALVPLVATLYRSPRGSSMLFRVGYLFGVAFFLSHLWWVAHLSSDSSITMPWLMVPAVIALVAYLAVYPALFCLLLGVLGRNRPFLFVLLGPALWMILEWLRSSGELGFPWAALGYSLARHPIWIQGAAFFGVAGVGALIVFINMVWSGALLAGNSRKRIVFFAAGMTLLFLSGVGGRQAIARYDGTVPKKEFKVALVQPNVDLALKWKPEFSDSTFRLIERLARHAAALEPGLIVFPETSAPVFLRHNLMRRAFLDELVGELGVGLFIGFLDGRHDGPDGEFNVYNSSGLLSPEGGLVLYDKMHLLPFGEAIPFAWRFRSFRSLDFGQANFQRGPPADPIPSPVGKLGPLICFESIFPGLSRRFTALGADVLVNITNDGWFGDTPGPKQHNEMAILRAVENRRFLIRSANTGITMVVDPAGRVTRMLGFEQEGILVEKIHHVDRQAFYTRHGDAPLMAASLLVIILSIPLAWRDRVRRRDTEN